jgi:hypothetical protein
VLYRYDEESDNIVPVRRGGPIRNVNMTQFPGNSQQPRVEAHGAKEVTNNANGGEQG